MRCATSFSLKKLNSLHNKETCIVNVYGSSWRKQHEIHQSGRKNKLPYLVKTCYVCRWKSCYEKAFHSYFGVWILLCNSCICYYYFLCNIVVVDQSKHFQINMSNSKVNGLQIIINIQTVLLIYIYIFRFLQQV